MKLELTDVGRAFDGEDALRDVSLTVDEGEVVAVIGPSGAGKTTLLRLAGCFTPPDEGRVRLDGIDPWSRSRADRRELRRRIGFVFQQASLFETTVERNVDSGLRVRRNWQGRLFDTGRRLAAGGRLRRRLHAALSRVVPRALRRRWRRATPPPIDPDRVDRALSLVGLEDSRERDARSLSGGEAQRVAFARAVAYDPDLLVLDEPTSDLDPRNTAILEHAIDRARADGHGVLLATHDMHQARRVADRIGVLVDGELIESGSPTRIFESPADPRTRRFVDGDLLYDVAGEGDAVDALRRS